MAGHLFSSLAPAAPGAGGASPAPCGWQALRRRIVEISAAAGAGATSSAAHWLREAQADGEPAAWIQQVGAPLFPPDLDEAGVCLAALAVIQVPAAAGPCGVARAAEILLRSGAYGLVVLDLTAGTPPPRVPWQGRLAALARQHEAAVVVLTRAGADAPSLGHGIGLRLSPRRRRLDGRLFLLEHAVLKHKGGGSLPMVPLPRRGPWGVA